MQGVIIKAMHAFHYKLITGVFRCFDCMVSCYYFVPRLLSLHVYIRSSEFQFWWPGKSDAFIAEQLVHKRQLLKPGFRCPWEVLLQPICPYINVRWSTMTAFPILHTESLHYTVVKCIAFNLVNTVMKIQKTFHQGISSSP